MSAFRGLGFSSVWIFSALYFREVLGLNVLDDGLIITVATLAGAIFQRYSGIYSDMVGHKKVVVAAASVFTFLFLILVASSAVRTSPIYYTIIFVALTISGSVIQPSIYSIVSASSEIKSKGFSALRIGANIGWGLGPAVGGFAVYFLGYYYLFIFGFASSFISLLFALLLHESKPSATSLQRASVENTMLIVLSFTALLIFMVQAQETVTLSNYAHIVRGLNYFELGLLYGAGGLIVVLTQGFMYKMIRILGNYNSFLIGSVIYTAGFLSFGFAYNLLGMLASTVVLTIGEDLAFPSSAAMVAIVSKKENIGKNMGMYNAFISVGRATGPLLGGAVLNFTSAPVEIWGLVTLSGFVSAAIFGIVFRGQSRIQESQNEDGLAE